MILERTEHPGWLSNAYLVADGPGGHGVLVDSNGISEPLLARARADGITLTHVLVTHGHGDHVVEAGALGRLLDVPVLGPAGVADVTEEVRDGEVIRSGALAIRVVDTPGHCSPHVSYLVDESDVLTADCLFKGTVGGTRMGSYAELHRSIMDVLMALPHGTRVHPGHREPTTIGAEWEANPFVRVWRGLDPGGDERCTVGGREARLVLWAPDYDGGNKAWVRFPDEGDVIVGGSQVRR